MNSATLIGPSIAILRLISVSSARVTASRGARRRPVGVPDEREAGTVEIGVKQLAKTSFPNGGIRLVVEYLDGTVPERVHEGDGIGGINQGRRRHRRGHEQTEKTSEKEATRHVG